MVTEYLLDVQPGLYKVIAATASGSTDRFIHDPMGIAQHEDNSGSWHWMAKDGLGTVRGVYDDTLAEAYAADRDPYGDLIASTGSNPTPFEYTGEPEDQNGLLHLRARYYDPNLAVFNSLDPLELGNRYAYVGANPIGRIDPSGLYAIPVPENYGGGCQEDGNDADYEVCYLSSAIESECASGSRNRSTSLNRLLAYGIEIADDAFTRWRNAEISDSKIDQRLCEMSHAVAQIANQLQAVVIDRLTAGNTCGQYDLLLSLRTYVPSLIFQDILGGKIEVIGEPMSDAAMNASPSGGFGDRMRINIPGRTMENRENDTVTNRNCFHDIFVHELSHIIDYRITLAAGFTNIIDDDDPHSVVGDDYLSYTRRVLEIAPGAGLVEIRTDDVTGEFGPDALANLFLGSISIADVQTQVEDLLDRTVCGGMFTAFDGGVSEYPGIAGATN